MKKILLLFLIGTCYCQEPPIVLNQFTGGLNTRVDSGLIDIKDTQDSFNMVFDDHYTLQSRLGSVLVSTLPVQGNILGMYEFNQQNGKRWYVVQIDSSIYATEDLKDWVLVVSSLSVFYQCNYAVFQDKIWVTNAIDYVGSWDGENYASYSFIPKGRYILTEDNKLWIAGDPGAPSTVYYSRNDLSPTNNSSWLDTNSFVINEDDGDIITGFVSYQNKKVVFKKRGIYTISGDSIENATIRNANNKYGCLDGRSIQNHKGEILFLANDGLRGFDGGNVRLISEKVYTDLKSVKQVNSGGLFEWRLSKVDDFESPSLTTTKDKVDVLLTGQIQISSVNYTWNSDATFVTTLSTNCAVQEGVIRLSTTTTASDVKVNYTVGWETKPNVNNGSTIQNIDFMYDTSASSMTSATFVTMDTYYTPTSETVSPKRWNPFSSSVNSLYFTFDFGIVREMSKFTWKIRTSNGLTFINTPEYNSAENYAYIRLGWYESATNKFKPISTNNNSYFIAAEELGLNLASLNVASYAFLERASILRGQVFYGLNWETSPYQDSYLLNVNTDKITLNIYRPPSNINNTKWSSFNFAIYDITFFEKGTAIAYSSTGVYTSSSLDCTYTNPQWGIFEAIVSTQSTDTIQFYVQSSSSTNEGVHWSDLKAILPGQNIKDVGLPCKRYIRWTSTMTSLGGTTTPTIFSVTINAIQDTTGTYRSPVYNVRNVSAWHVFSVTDNTSFYNGFGSTITYYIRQGISVIDCIAGSGVYYKQPKNKNIVSTFGITKPYIQWKAELECNDANQNPYIDSVGIGWFTGEAVKNVASCVYNNRYYLAVSTGSDPHNSLVWLFDNNNQFTKYEGLKCATLLSDTLGDIYYGAANNNKIYKMETSWGDQGVAIPTLWTSKDFDFGDIPVKLLKIAVTGKCSNPTQPITVSYSKGFITDWKPLSFQLSSGTYSTEIVNVPDDSYFYNLKFKVSSNVLNFAYDIRKIAVYYERLDSMPTGVKR